METITSRENAKIKYACAVRDSEKQRAADGLFFAEGPKLCLELAKSCTPRAMYATAAALAKTPELAQFDPAEIAPHVAEKLSGTKSNQGVFALFETPVPPADTLDTARRILMLEGVQDPGNVGTLLRSAAAFGFDAVVLGPGCASPLSPKTLRSSMGAAGRLPTLHSDDLPAALAALRARGVTTLCKRKAKDNIEPISLFKRFITVCFFKERRNAADYKSHKKADDFRLIFCKQTVDQKHENHKTDNAADAERKQKIKILFRCFEKTGDRFDRRLIQTHRNGKNSAAESGNDCSRTDHKSCENFAEKQIQIFPPISNAAEYTSAY